jgi:hypothetical protein
LHGLHLRSGPIRRAGGNFHAEAITHGRKPSFDWLGMITVVTEFEFTLTLTPTLDDVQTSLGSHVFRDGLPRLPR